MRGVTTETSARTHMYGKLAMNRITTKRKQKKRRKLVGLLPYSPSTGTVTS